MLGPLMAALAKKRRPVVEELCVIASVRCMAGQAVLINRRMFPHERPSFFRMARITEFIHGVRLDHFCTEVAMRVMAARAKDLSLFEGMMRLPIRLPPNVLMTFKTEGYLICLQKLRMSGMHRMAIVACNVPVLMFAHVPECDLFCFLMAGKAFCRSCFWVHLFTKIEYVYPPSTALFHVFCTGTVAGFAGLLIFRSLRLSLGMNGPGICRILRFMTPFARGGSDVSLLFIC